MAQNGVKSDINSLFDLFCFKQAEFQLKRTDGDLNRAIFYKYPLFYHINQALLLLWQLPSGGFYFSKMQLLSSFLKKSPVPPLAASLRGFLFFKNNTFRCVFDGFEGPDPLKHHIFNNSCLIISINSI